MADIFRRAFHEQISRIIDKYENIDDTLDDVIEMNPGDSDDSHASSESENGSRDAAALDSFYMSARRTHGITFRTFDFWNTRLGFAEAYDKVFGRQDFNSIYRRIRRKIHD